MNSEQTPQQFTEWPSKIQKILFIIVMSSEAQHIKEDFQLKEINSENPHKIYQLFKNTYQNRELYLIQGRPDPIYRVDPVGSDQASILTQLGIEAVQPDLIMSIGTCGGIIYKEKTENVKQYDVCIPTEFRFIDREIIIDFYKGFITSQYPVLNPQKVVEILGLKPVVCGCTNSFTKENHLAREKKVDIVEMEAAAEARVAYLNGVPFCGLKIISDVEMEDEEERSKCFLEFLKQGPQALSNQLKRFLDNLDKFLSKQ
ncbi:hypothetical protein PPERSA_07061 [Pseudocohnilembus persalinus]|uniref:Nucleoside phosphorylase domain-containing protein n=1 Tax=Pseudocohnilembus persalinus TaxID=266149 RepID=A0A0V0QAM6_PSEPJ|nr:hypothetical protein PPERSA_07061 [Pseudocohnilembus persalinus]|eukprot:KRW99289.1 hypothetical protein PPERSA_07061 [Pseudocohnilembus persalinus]